MEDDKDKLFLNYKDDDMGTKDSEENTVINRGDISWEVDFGINYSNEAVKHSDFSSKLDFGREWFNIPCSNQYWDDVSFIFDDLKEEILKGTGWSSVPDKEENIYAPLLQAFMDEVQRAYLSDSTVPRKIVEYLIGTNDYYKIARHDNEKIKAVNTINAYDSFNRPIRITVAAISVPVTELPTEIIALRFKPGSNSIVEMYLNNGWQIRFRIHGANTNLEQGLKLEVQFIGLPETIVL